MNKILKFYLLILIVFILTGVVITGFALTTSNYEEYKYAFLWGMNLSLGLIVLSSLLCALWFVVKWIYGHITFFGSYPKARMLAFGIVFVLFSKTILSVISTSVNPMISSFKLLVYFELSEVEPKSVKTEATSTYTSGYNDGYDDGYDDGLNNDNEKGDLIKSSSFNSKKEQRNDYIKTVSNIAIQWGRMGIQVPINSIQNLIAGNILRNLILAMALAALLGYLFDIYIFDDGENSFKLFLSDHRYTLLFISIFIFGSFLSISSIIAIPEVKKSNDKSGLYSENFEESIKKIPVSRNVITYSTRNFDERPYTALLVDLDSIKGQLDAVSEDSTNQITLKIKKERISRIGNEVRSLIRDSQSAVNQFKGLENGYEEKLVQIRTSLANDYEYNTNGSGAANDVRNYFRSLLNYFNSYAQDYASYISVNNRRLTERFESNLRLLELMKTSINNNKEPTDFFFNQSEYIPFRTYLRKPVLRRTSEANKKNFFKAIASWLIFPQSDEMVLIAGMLGFGFLGAGVSSIIRTRGEGKDVEHYKNGVTSVLIGGVSASLVIFLGAKGGFAIFSNNEVDLNPYSLLFLCLIGAVYSESVWSKAYRYITTDGGEPTETEKKKEREKEEEPEDDSDEVNNKENSDGNDQEKDDEVP